jgi:hypothetical protein
MKVRNQSRMNSAFSFTVEDHLWVQKEIEHRAYELWLAGGCRQMAGLNDWLQAEREILEKFLPTLFEGAKSRPFPNKSAQFMKAVLGAAG